MRLLLDTHAFIWLDSASAKLSSIAHTTLADQNNVLLVSLATIWEMQIKFQLGKLQLRSPLLQIIEEQQEKNRIQILPITLSHILGLAMLPDHHRDPFDRLLIAQAMVENIPLLTDDAKITPYPVQAIW